jgi:hypothetical protein
LNASRLWLGTGDFASPHADHNAQLGHLFQRFSPLLRICIENRVSWAPILATVTSICPYAAPLGLFAYSPMRVFFHDTATLLINFKGLFQPSKLCQLL